MPGMYTWGEVFGIAGHAIRGGRQVVRSGSENVDGGHGDRADRIADKAAERREREAAVAFGALEAAENELARTEHALRTARGREKDAARRARNDAKAMVRRTDAAARRYR
ncbi:hypothetical protein [Streptomyces sp. NPDC005799]|uniref:hypothetical protein n=1 Tax=Streptomyces sp. NPDC005799 TaxID=3154678 RepID=UPI00340B6214